MFERRGDAKMKKLKDVFKNGLFGENPIFRLVLGTCPTIAVSTSAMNAIGMGSVSYTHLDVYKRQVQKLPAVCAFLVIG